MRSANVRRPADVDPAPGAVQGATLDAAEGACIVRPVLSKPSREALTVGDRGPLHGVRAERFA